MILLNDFQRQWLDTGEETLEAVRCVGRRGWYVLGQEVAQFETALAQTWGVRHAVGVASGLDALEISLRCVDCGAGDRVLTTPVTAFATTLAIAKLGAVPVFADCDQYGLIDLDRCDAILRGRPDVRFFLPVHLYGHSLDLRRLRGLQSDAGISVIEDCAQSVLSGRGGEHTGTAGRIAATSFYPTKNLGALGDGGAILTNDGDLARRARVFRDYGQTAKYEHAVTGYNSRLDELQAAILRRVHLPRLERWTHRRKEIARAYLDGIRHPSIRMPGAPAGSDSCWHLFPALIPPARKKDFISYMRGRGITVGEHYPVAIIDQPAMKDIPHEILDGCENARRLCSSEVSLPIHAYLTDDEVDAVLDACNAWGG